MASATSTVCMNFFAMPTLKNERACLRRPSSIKPFFSSNVTLARLRTGIESVGSLLRSAAVMTVSAMPTSFFSTSPLLFAFFPAMFFLCLLGSVFLGFGRFKCQHHLFSAWRLNLPRILFVRFFRITSLCNLPGFRLTLGPRGHAGFVQFQRQLWRRHAPAPLTAGQNRHLAFGALGADDNRMGQPFRSTAIVSQKLIGFRAAGTFHGDLLQLLFEFLFRELPAL